MILIIWSIILYVYTSLKYNIIEQLGLILIIFDWMLVFCWLFTAIEFSMCFMSAILLAKHSMPGTIFRNLQQYMCHFCNSQVQSNIGGMSDGVPRMISVLLKFIFVSVSIEIQACPKGPRNQWWHVDFKVDFWNK